MKPLLEFYRALFLVSLGLVFSTVCMWAQNDLTLVYTSRRAGAGDGTPESDARLKVYIQGKKLRTEYDLDTPIGHSRSIQIQRCDLGRVINLIPSTKHYLEWTFPTTIKPQRLPAYLQQQASVDGPTNFDVDVVVESTNETKEAFGYTARRYRRIVSENPSPGLEIRGRRTEESIWFLEIPSVEPCYAVPLRSEFSGDLNRFEQSRIRVRMQKHGEHPNGVELRNDQAITRFVSGEDPQHQHIHDSTLTLELVDLKKDSLDPALFEVPRGFRVYKK